MPEHRPLPTSPAVRVRDFRHRALPYLVFAAVLTTAVVIWNRRLGRPAMVGRTETAHVVVNARKSGVIVAIRFDLLQRVKKGDIIAELVPEDADVARAGLSSKLESTRAQLLQNRDRTTASFQQLRTDWLRQKIELAATQVDLQLAESEYERSTALHEERAASNPDLQAKSRNRDALRAKVENLTQLIAQLEPQVLKSPMSNTEDDDNPAERAVAAATVLMEKQLEAQADAAVVRAPMDGIISAINAHVGAELSAGDPIVTLGALRPTRIQAFVRQPLRLQFHAGDTVQITSRGTRLTRPAKVLQVGAQLEPIETNLLPAVASSHNVELGLPLLIESPASLELAPGEIVNITAAAFK
jgi:multidrug resistance efflux pump